MKIIAVTNRLLCGEDFNERLKKTVEAGADFVILREKDLTEAEYGSLAEAVFKICGERLVINSRYKTAERLGIGKIQLSLRDFMRLGRRRFETVGVSVHSLEEAKRAENFGADFLIAGHIFKTDCKKGLPPKGVGFLKEIAGEVKIPLYAIGGITPKTAPLLKKTEVEGVCLMSSIMTAESPKTLIDKIKDTLI